MQVGFNEDEFFGRDLGLEARSGRYSLFRAVPRSAPHILGGLQIIYYTLNRDEISHLWALLVAHHENHSHSTHAGPLALSTSLIMFCPIASAKLACLDLI